MPLNSRPLQTRRQASSDRPHLQPAAEDTGVVPPAQRQTAATVHSYSPAFVALSIIVETLAGGTHIHFEGGVGGDGQQQVSPNCLVLLTEASLPTVPDWNQKRKEKNFIFPNYDLTDLSKTKSPSLSFHFLVNLHESVFQLRFSLNTKFSLIVALEEKPWGH